MFDFRYHVASLAAVFVALVLGILLGVGLSGRGFVDDAERSNLERELGELRNARDTAVDLLVDAERRADAFDEYTGDTYAALMRDRLRDRRIGLVIVGPVDQSATDAVRRAVGDAGGALVRSRSLDVPLELAALDDALRSAAPLRRFVGADAREDLGRALAAEFVRGGASPLWDAVSGVIVGERSGPQSGVLDGVVVVRTVVQPQTGETQAFLRGVYRGLGSSGAPAVAGASSGAAVPVRTFRQAGISTIDSIDRPDGRVALVLLLAGGEPGSYGIAESAQDGVVPTAPLTNR